MSAAAPAAVAAFRALARSGGRRTTFRRPAG